MGMKLSKTSIEQRQKYNHKKKLSGIKSAGQALTFSIRQGVQGEHVIRANDFDHEPYFSASLTKGNPDVFSPNRCQNRR